jgi:hypothetical protein
MSPSISTNPPAPPMPITFGKHGYLSESCHHWLLGGLVKTEGYTWKGEAAAKGWTDSPGSAPWCFLGPCSRLKGVEKPQGFKMLIRLLDCGVGQLRLGAYKESPPIRP